jgi:syntenin-1
LAVRDRPFERTITLQRDSAGNVGILFSDGRITHIAKDTSAARNGVLIEHQLIEVNGQNVVGMSDKNIQKLFRESPEYTLTITVMPCYIYDHIVKCIGGSLFKKMDHSVPDF